MKRVHDKDSTEGDVKEKPTPSAKDHFATQVHAKSARKMKARRADQPVVWLGIGMMGIVGWSIAIPTLGGAALGLWLDSVKEDTHSWTLALIVAGLTLGCFNAWYWIGKEDKAIHDDQETKHDKDGSDE